MLADNYCRCTHDCLLRTASETQHICMVTSTLVVRAGSATSPSRHHCKHTPESTSWSSRLSCICGQPSVVSVRSTGPGGEVDYEDNTGSQGLSAYLVLRCSYIDKRLHRMIYAWSCLSSLCGSRGFPHWSFLNCSPPHRACPVTIHHPIRSPWWCFKEAGLVHRVIFISISFPALFSTKSIRSTLYPY